MTRETRETRKTVRDTLRLVSHFAGRLRVRAETFRVLPEVGAAVAEEIAGLDGVSEATLSPVTGSLLVRYEPRRVQLPRLFGAMVRAGGLHGLALDVPAGDTDGLEPPGARVRRALGGLDRRARAATAGRIDIRTAIPAALTGTGIAMLLAGRRRVPEWYDLLFWGFVSFCNLNPPSPTAAATAATARPPAANDDVDDVDRR